MLAGWYAWGSARRLGQCKVDGWPKANYVVAPGGL